MSLFKHLGRPRLPFIPQNEVAECGLASLAMVASYHGHDVSLNGLRQRHAVSLSGATLLDLITMAGGLKLGARALRLDLDQLGQLKLPCILHWDLFHFVVLKELRGQGCIIHDPAVGVREVTREQLSRHFSGVALEVTPLAEFKPQTVGTRARLSDLWQRMEGWKRAAWQIGLLSLLLQLFAVFLPLYSQIAIDEVLGRTDHALLLLLALGFAGLTGLQAATEALRSWVLLHVGQAFTLQVKYNLMHHLLRLPANFFEKRQIGDIVSRLDSVQPIQKALTHSVLGALLDGAMALTTAALMLAYSPALAAWVLGSMLLYALLTAGLYPWRRLREQEALVASAEERSQLLQTMRSARTIKIFGRESLLQAVWSKHATGAVNAQVSLGRLDLWLQAARTLLIQGQFIAVVYLGVDMAMRQQLTLGMLFAFLAYRGNFCERAEQLLQRLVELRLLGVHMERLADVVQTPTEDDSPKLGGLPVQGRLSLQGVSFRYGPHQPLLLDHVDLDIQPGEFVAIIGASGGGKTSLLKVMLGLMPPTDGVVLVEGVPLDAFGTRPWREKIAVVSQNESLMYGTLADNIAFFDPQIDMERVIASAQAACVHEDIMALPMGYLSIHSDLGSVMSGGQAQRVLLARALYRQPRLLFLDEGTANLDQATELRVAALIENLPITRVVIAHRPELVRRAHRVFELRQGKLHEIQLPPEAEQRLPLHDRPTAQGGARPPASHAFQASSEEVRG